MRVIVGGGIAVLLTGLALLRLARPGAEAVIADRNGIQARLAIPKDLREFPVEQYIGRGDWYIYRCLAPPGGQCYWRLQILCASNDAEKWCLAFRTYLQSRGKHIERGGDATFAGQEHGFYLSQDSGGSAVIWLRNLSGRLQIAFEYRKARVPSKIWRTKLGRRLATILVKVGLPIDAITHPS